MRLDGRWSRSFGGKWTRIDQCTALECLYQLIAHADVPDVDKTSLIALRKDVFCAEVCIRLQISKLRCFTYTRITSSGCVQHAATIVSYFHLCSYLKPRRRRACHQQDLCIHVPERVLLCH